MSKTTNTNSTSTTNENLTQTPTNPSWVSGGLANLGSQISALSGANPYSFVAGANPLETSAATSLSSPNLGGSWNYDGAANLYRSTAQAPANTYTATTGQASSLLPNIDSYMSPYVKDVVNSSLADYNFGAGQTSAQNNLNLANDDTFGGSSGAIATSMTNDAINRGRASLVSNALNSGYGQAATLANEDADRQQQMTLANDAAINAAGQFNAGEQDTAANRQQAAAQGLTSVANDQNQTQLSDAAAQASLGETLRQIQQQYDLAPLSLLGTQASLFSGLPLSLLHGQDTSGQSTTNSNSTQTTTDPLGEMGSLLGGLGGLGTGLGALGIGFGSAGTAAGLSGLTSAAGAAGNFSPSLVNLLGGLGG